MQFPKCVSAATVLSFFALASVASAQNQYVILYPGGNSSATILQGYSPISGGLLNSISINNLPPGTFQIIPMPDESAYYLLSNSGTPVSVMDSAFQSVTQVASIIPTTPTTAALTPDGTKLVILANNVVYVLSTATNTLLNSNGLSLGGNAIDVAMSLDSNRAYVLTTSQQASLTGTIVTAIDLTQSNPAVIGNQIAFSYSPSNPPTGLTMAPTGYLYLADSYNIQEINPINTSSAACVSLPTPLAAPCMAPAGPALGSFIQFTGKPYITPDGRFVVSANTRSTGHSLVEFDLTSSNRTAIYPGGTDAASSDTLVQLYSNGSDSSGTDHLYALGSSGALYDITLGANVTVSPSSLDVYLASGQVPTFTGVQVSNELPPKLMWLTSSLSPGVLLQLDLTTHNLSQIPIPTSPVLQLSTIQVNPEGGGASMIKFNDNQTVAAGAQSALPVVVQLLDANGRGVFHQQIQFQSTIAGVTFTTPNVVTGSGGYAETYVIAPNTPGVPFTVSAFAQGGTVPQQNFNFTVAGTASTGGGEGGTPSSLAGTFLVAGDGQLVQDTSALSAPMAVQVLDSNGNPLPGATVTFLLTSGPGGVLQGTSITDINGMAYTTFISTTISGFIYSIPSNVQATGPSGNPVNFTITTFISELPGNIGQAGLPSYQETVGACPGPLPFRTAAGRTLNVTAGALIKGAYQVCISGSAAGQAPIAGVGLRATNSYGNTICNPLLSSSPLACETTQLAGEPYGTCVGDPLSDVTGFVSCDLKVGSTLGTWPIFFSIGESQTLNPVTLVVSPGNPSVITPTGGNNQSGKPGTPLSGALQVKVTDAGGNPLNNVPITWSTVVGNAVLSSTSTMTNTNGLTSINVTLGGTAGPIIIYASVSKTLFAQFNETVNVVVATVTPVSGDNQTTFTNTSFPSPLIVVVKDAGGNPVANSTVTFAATLGASVNPVTVTTLGNGQASTTLTAGSATGNVLVSAAASGIQANFTNLKVLLPGPQVTSASFYTAGSVSSPLTPCGLSIAQGTGIATGVSGTLTPPGFGPNPTNLGPVQSLSVNGIAAPITFVSNNNGVEQVGFQTPCDVPVGTATITMNVLGGTTTVTGVQVAAYSPGMFSSIASDGNAYAVAIRPDGSYVSPTNPAVQGEVISVLVTGLGQATPAITTNSAGVNGQLVNAAIIGGVNNAGVLVVKSTYAASLIGYYYVDIQIPSDTLTGPAQPIAVAVQLPGSGQLVFGNGVNIPIAPGPQQ